MVLSDDGCIGRGENHRLGTTREGHACVLCGGNDFGFVVTGAKRYRAYRDLISPLTWLLSPCGRGDIIEAELRGIG